MNRILILLAMLVVGNLQAQQVNLVCEGQMECPEGCWGSDRDLKRELDGLVTVEDTEIFIDFQPMSGTWAITKKEDSQIQFSALRSGIMMVGSLHRYTGELIAHNESFQSDGFTVYVHMSCSRGKKLF